MIRSLVKIAMTLFMVGLVLGYFVGNPPPEVSQPKPVSALVIAHLDNTQLLVRPYQRREAVISVTPAQYDRLRDGDRLTLVAEVPGPYTVQGGK